MPWVQVSAALTMLYYNTLAVWLKTTRFQLLSRRYFPALVLGLLTFAEYKLEITSDLEFFNLTSSHSMYGRTCK